MGLFDGILNPVSQLLFGRSATGEPAQMTSTTGPLTPEGQALWNMVYGQLQKTPPTQKVTFANNDWNVRTPNYNSLLGVLTSLDASRRGTMQPFTPDQGGILGSLAPILGAMGAGSNKTSNNGNDGLGLSNVGGASYNPLKWLLG
jgi:hypothetical protein